MAVCRSFKSSTLNRGRGEYPLLPIITPSPLLRHINRISTGRATSVSALSAAPPGGPKRLDWAGPCPSLCSTRGRSHARTSTASPHHGASAARGSGLEASPLQRIRALHRPRRRRYTQPPPRARVLRRAGPARTVVMLRKPAHTAGLRRVCVRSRARGGQACCGLWILLVWE